MNEAGSPRQPPHRSAAASLSFWLGLFSLALAIPPTFAIFFAPGYWMGALETLVRVSPVLAAVALVAGAARRSLPRARLGLTLATIALALLFAWLVRGQLLLRSAL